MKFNLKVFIANQWLVFAVRLLLGGCFFAASLSKLQNPDYFTATVVSYGLLPDSLAQLYGLVLPWAELVIGCALILGIFPLYTSWLSILLSLSFAIAGTYSLVNSRLESCGCFGQWLQFSTPVALGIDILLIILAVELLIHRSKAGFLSIGALLDKYSVDGGKRERALALSIKLAVIILAVLATSFLIPNSSIDSTTSRNIDNILNSDKYALLYFYAEGCSTCEEFKPVLAGIERDFASKIKVLRIDYYSSPQDVRKYAVVKTPSILIITGRNSKGGYVVFQRFEGKIDSTELRNSLSTTSQR